MSILINKLTALTLASTIGAVSLGTVAYASPSHNSQNQTSITQKVNNQGLHSKFNEQDFIKLMQPYIKVENNKYVIDASIYENPQISESDINLLKEMLSKANKQIIKNNLKNVSVTNGAVKQEYNGPGICLAGVNGIHFYWWGFYLYLSSGTTTAIINGGINGGAFILGTIFSETAVGPFLSAIASGVISGYLDNTAEAEDGCVVSVNYIEGVQDVWAQ